MLAQSREVLFIVQVGRVICLELIEQMARDGWKCKLLTGSLDRELSPDDGILVLRGRKMERNTARQRIWTWSLFTLQAFWVMLKHRHVPMVIVTTPPSLPLLMPVLRLIGRVRYVILAYDIYPEALERMGYFRTGGLLARLWRWLDRKAMVGAQGVMTIGPVMARTLQTHLRDAQECPITIIPTWVDTDTIRPLAKESNPFVKEHALAGKFVVMYSGNFGATHDLGSILDAAELLRGEPAIQFVLIGGGAKQGEVQGSIRARQLPNVLLLPFQPVSVLPQSLSAADCAIVSLDKAYAGISVPSKTASSLAAGAAILAISPPDTELTILIKQHQCGMHVPPGDAKAMAAAIRSLHASPTMHREMCIAARRAAETSYARARLLPELASFVAGGLSR